MGRLKIRTPESMSTMIWISERTGDKKKIPYEKVCQIHGPLSDNPDNPN